MTTGAPPSSAAPSRLWLLLFAVAAVEVVGHLVIQSRVVPDTDWDAAAAFVRSEWRERDVVSAAPRWADPLMRRAVGDLLSTSSAGRADLEGFERLWVLSIRGHRAAEAPEGAPELVRSFGAVTVERWALPRVEVHYDFADHVGEASVVRTEGDREVPCRLTRSGAQGGGLGSGPITPAERHVCDPGRPWLWVGTTVEEDLAMLPRRCVWQHPPGGEDVVRTTFAEVPLGERLVLHAGLWWEHERTMDHGLVSVRVLLDGVEIGTLVHRDGDGWKRLEAAIPEERRGGVGSVSIETSAPDPQFRTVCWAASTRSSGEGE